MSGWILLVGAASRGVRLPKVTYGPSGNGLEKINYQEAKFYDFYSDKKAVDIFYRLYKSAEDRFKVEHEQERKKFDSLSQESDKKTKEYSQVLSFLKKSGLDLSFLDSKHPLAVVAKNEKEASIFSYQQKYKIKNLPILTKVNGIEIGEISHFLDFNEDELAEIKNLFKVYNDIKKEESKYLKEFKNPFLSKEKRTLAQEKFKEAQRQMEDVFYEKYIKTYEEDSSLAHLSAEKRRELIEASNPSLGYLREVSTRFEKFKLLSSLTGEQRQALIKLIKMEEELAKEISEPLKKTMEHEVIARGAKAYKEMIDYALNNEYVYEEELQYLNDLISNEETKTRHHISIEDKGLKEKYEAYIDAHLSYEYKHQSEEIGPSKNRK